MIERCLTLVRGNGVLRQDTLTNQSEEQRNVSPPYVVCDLMQCLSAFPFPFLSSQSLPPQLPTQFFIRFLIALHG